MLRCVYVSNQFCLTCFIFAIWTVTTVRIDSLTAPCSPSGGLVNQQKLNLSINFSSPPCWSVCHTATNPEQYLGVSLNQTCPPPLLRTCISILHHFNKVPSAITFSRTAFDMNYQTTSERTTYHFKLNEWKVLFFL